MTACPCRRQNRRADVPLGYGTLGSFPSPRLTDIHPAAENTFEYTREQALGQSIEELVVRPQAREATGPELARLASGGPGQTLGRRLQWAAWHADGHEVPIEMTMTATDEPAGRVFHVFAHDITTTQRASRFAAVESAVARGLAEASRAGSRLSTKRRFQRPVRASWRACSRNHSASRLASDTSNSACRLSACASRCADCRFRSAPRCSSTAR
ncbi:PAS domain-containing protein [Actinoplanes xinjiangensis]|uniref:PAS domain-containing protein n=1 Tax=Actinoplanes xinjiangensis TaxID=512350 RepID=UPI00343A624C